MIRASLLSIIAFFAVFTSVVIADPPLNVPDHLQQYSVTVIIGNGIGSGSIITRRIDNKDISFVWTAYHVIASLRYERRSHVAYHDVEIYRELTDDGEIVGNVVVRCKVLATSPIHDLALLQIRDPNLYHGGVEFVLDQHAIAVGTEVYHCGSPMNIKLGHNSVTSGIIAANARMIDEQTFYQITAPSLPGSSGGIVALKTDGKYIGMLTSGVPGCISFNYIIPSRRIVTWADAQGLRWAVDTKAALPTTQQLLAIPIEDSAPIIVPTPATKNHLYEWWESLLR